MAKHLDSFYASLGQPPAQFQLQVDKDFVGKLKDWNIFGGATTTERKQAIQEAVNALAVYSAMGFPSAESKKRAFAAVYTKYYKEPLPPSSPDALAIATKLKACQAKFNILTRSSWRRASFSHEFGRRPPARGAGRRLAPS